MTAFAEYMKSRMTGTVVDELESAKLYLDGEGEAGVRNLADCLVIGVIPPDLRQFFTRSLADDEYVEGAKRGMKGLFETCVPTVVQFPAFSLF